MKSLSTVLAGALALSTVQAVPQDAETASVSGIGGWVKSNLLQALIRPSGLMRHLSALDRIASENGGNRAFGLPGYDASVSYVQSQLQKSRAFTSWTQDFPALFTRVESIDFSVGETSYHVVGLTYSPSTSAEGIDAPLVAGPAGAAACDVASYQGLDVQDKIVLVQRGTCPTGGTLAGKLRPAAAAGAAAVIIYNNVPTLTTGGSLSAPDPANFVPGGFINQDDGEALLARLQAGEAVAAHFQQTQTIEEKVTRNVFAESKGGDASNVLMLGAHLDSVQAGAGINDDGSGSALILELFNAVQHFRFRNKIRFAWWGAEENGLVGSRFYTRNLPAADRDALLAYLNFDMVSRGYFGVFDGDGSTHGLAAAPGSGAIESLFVEHLEAKGLNVTPAVFTGGSDYASFMTELQKPVGGLHTGTGVAQDDCYHQACDVYGNANSSTLTINAKAAAHVLATLAMRGHEIIPKAPSNASVQARADDGVFGALADIESIAWTELEGERHTNTCGHDI